MGWEGKTLHSFQLCKEGKWEYIIAHQNFGMATPTLKKLHPINNFNVFATKHCL